MTKNFWQKNHVWIIGLLVLALTLTITWFYSFNVQCHICNCQFTANNFRSTIFGTSLAIAISSLCAGGFFGFLFGVPKTGNGAEGETADTNGVVHNNNLSQISDWLTKIIIGAAITQLGPIKDFLIDLKDGLAPALGGGSVAGLYGLSLASAYFLMGFVFNYLFSSLGYFRLIKGLTAKETAQETLEEQTRRNAEAIRLSSASMHELQDFTPTDEANMFAAIKDSSEMTKTLIFEKARDYRDGMSLKEALTLTGPDAHHQKKMEGVSRVFKALVITGDGKNHRYHAQLGYCLLEMDKLQLKDCIKHLETAIALRDEQKEKGAFRFYELALAKAYILQGDPLVHNKIEELLAKAGGEPSAAQAIAHDVLINDWCKPQKPG